MPGPAGVNHDGGSGPGDGIGHLNSACSCRIPGPDLSGESLVNQRNWIVTVLVGWVTCSAPVGFVGASDLDDAFALYRSGKYEEAEAFAAEQVERGIWNERWPRLLIRTQLTQGKYDLAKESYDAAIRRYPTSLTLRVLGLDAMRRGGMEEEASGAKQQILRLMQTSQTRFASRDNRIAAGRFFSSRGEDARQILEFFYDRVRDADPEFLEAYIATAELALDKGDFKVAADTLQRAAEFDDQDPRLHYLLARSWESGDGEKSYQALERALELNPRHVPSLLFKANGAIDREQYDMAEALIREVMSVNPTEPEAWALLAVLAHLRGNYDNEAKLRQAALSTWPKNPQVDYLIGLKLSQKYRFKEGAEYQRRAIESDPLFTPARFQLAQDLLRLGIEDVGWTLAKQVAEDDRYNVVAHNLATLNDRIKDYVVLEADGIRVRMEQLEASVYGDAVLDLLQEAKRVLCEKYDVAARSPVTVEIYPQQKDFAIRTFGLPGGAGFLGVCFGQVITANSPASQGERPANWRSVLWHEFCHVVTLQKTNNRMPRWLSEGISVYEERQKDRSWGESMTPVYREMLLDDALTPVSDLSAAFLNPPSPIHLQFAYYQSSMVIEFLVERHGIDAIKQVLDDLGDGLPINDALQRHVGSIDRLDAEFAAYAREHAESFAPQADWKRDDFPEKPSLEQLLAWVDSHPDSYWGLRALGRAYFASGQLDKARTTLEKIRTMGAVTGEAGGPLEMLAQVYSEMDDPVSEKEVLEQLVSLSSDALPALTRLIDMATASENWDAAADYADRFTSINPLLATGHSAVARTGEALGDSAQVIRALRSLSHLDPVDPAGLDFRLARALAADGQDVPAMHHVLRALEEAPRYRQAHRLLLELEAKRQVETTGDDTTGDETESDRSADEGRVSESAGGKKKVE